MIVGGLAATEFVLFEPDRSQQVSTTFSVSINSVLLTTFCPVDQATNTIFTELVKRLTQLVIWIFLSQLMVKKNFGIV